MAIVLYAETKVEYEELLFDQQYGTFKNEHERVIVKYQKKNKVDLKKSGKMFKKFQDMPDIPRPWPGEDEDIF